MDSVIGVIQDARRHLQNPVRMQIPNLTQADLDCWNTTVSPEPATPLIGHLEPDLLTPQPLLECRRLGGDRGPRVAAGDDRREPAARRHVRTKRSGSPPSQTSFWRVLEPL